jgi:hypothetical protein
MNRINKRIMGVLLITVIMLSSCTKNFDSINKDPNRLTDVQPGTLLAPVQYNVMWALMSRCHSINHELMQYTVSLGTLDDVSLYVLKNSDYDFLWKNLYAGAGNMEQMYQLASNIKDVNNMAAAWVMQAWIFSNITDLFGDVPFTDALKGDSGILYPGFDKQQLIYDSLLARLKKANTLFDVNKPFVSGDLLYSNDVLKWKKFCNGLRLRLLMRVSNKAEMNAPAAIAEMYNNPTTYPLFASNDEEAMMRFSGVSPFINTFSTWRDADFNNRRMGKPLMDLMNTTVDGRRFRYAGKNTAGAYMGIASGYSAADTYTLSQNNGIGTSAYATTLQGANYPFPILTFSEVQFNLAEAAMKGWITATPATLYNKGIEASWRQWNCTWDGTAGTTYLARTSVKYVNTLECIMKQKYLALFFCGFEAWYEYRRTGFPVMPVGPAVENDGILPNRLEYPTIVQATNQENYANQAKTMGGDNLKVKVWWQQ